jgi:hypothetical protein
MKEPLQNQLLVDKALAHQLHFTGQKDMHVCDQENSNDLKLKNSSMSGTKRGQTTQRKFNFNGSTKNLGQSISKLSTHEKKAIDQKNEKEIELAAEKVMEETIN